MNEPLVYVLVINWNGREHLVDCFASLVASPYGNAKFVLVDNGSEDDSVALVESEFGHDSRVDTLRCGTNLGWSGGNNVGIRQAQEGGAAYVFLLNNDTAVSPDCVEHLVNAMEAQPSCGALAPRMVLFDQPSLLNSVGLEMSIIGSAWDRGIGRADGPVWHESVPAVGACGGACFLRASVLERTGLLPEEFEIYLDDLDLCLRIWNADFSVQTCPQAVVRHKFSATMGAGSWARHKYFLNTRNRFWLLLRHYPVRRLFATAPPLLVGECRALGRAVLAGEFWRLGAHLRAWCSAACYLPKARRFHRRQVNAHPAGGFWPLVRRRPYFCPPVIIPENGWYNPVCLGGETLRPMGPVATLAVPAGPLRLTLVNCYPDHGPAHVTLDLDGVALGSLESMDRENAMYEVNAGTLTLRAVSLFPADVVEGPMDIGAWLQIHSSGNPLV